MKMLEGTPTQQVEELRREVEVARRALDLIRDTARADMAQADGRVYPALYRMRLIASGALAEMEDAGR